MRRRMRQGPRAAGAVFLAWALCSAPFLAWAAVRCAGAMNPDGIAYVRLAGYWAAGRWDLAVSGYWGPLLPWLMVPFRWAGLGPLAAGRAAVALAALVFLAGGVALLSSAGIRGRYLAGAGGVLALAAVAWSIPAITPDLLLGGLLGLALAVLVGDRWPRERRVQLLAGGILGLAYLAKAVAFPLAILFSLGLAGIRAASGEVPARRLAGPLAATLLAFGLVAAPWVAVLSAKYGGFVFSTSGALNHALVAPGVTAPTHPYRRTIHAVERGRVTAWEDPSRMPYRRWSPLDGPREFRHQVRLSLRNYREALDAVGGLDLLRLAPALLLAALFFHRPFRENLREQRWRRAALPALFLVLIYLPVQASSTRYFWPVLPLALAAGIGTVTWVADEASSRGWAPGLLVGLLLLDFAVPPTADLPGRLAAARGPEVVAARSIARALREAGIREAVVGGGHVGLYVAFLLDRPWEGDLAPGPWSVAVARRAGAELGGAPHRRVLVARGEREALALLGKSFPAFPVPGLPAVGGAEIGVFLVPGGAPADSRGGSLTARQAAGDDSPGEETPAAPAAGGEPTIRGGHPAHAARDGDMRREER